LLADLVKKWALLRMERAEGDRKQVCESPAQYARLEKRAEV